LGLTPEPNNDRPQNIPWSPLGVTPFVFVFVFGDHFSNPPVSDSCLLVKSPLNKSLAFWEAGDDGCSCSVKCAEGAGKVGDLKSVE